MVIFQGWQFSRAGNFLGGSYLGGNLSGFNFPGVICLVPFYGTIEKIKLLGNNNVKNKRAVHLYIVKKYMRKSGPQ